MTKKRTDTERDKNAAYRLTEKYLDHNVIPSSKVSKVDGRTGYLFASDLILRAIRYGRRQERRKLATKIAVLTGLLEAYQGKTIPMPSFTTEKE